MKTVTVRGKGQFTIPAQLRLEMGIKEDMPLTVLSWDKKALLVIPQRLDSLDILKKTAKLAREKGISLDDLLLELEEMRDQA